MSPVTIRAAIEALDARKRNAGVDGAAVIEVASAAGDIPEGVIDGRLLTSGLDLDLEELVGIAHDHARTAILAALAIGPTAAVVGTWVDGVLTGALHAELSRQNAGASSSAEHPPPVIDPRVAASDDVVNALRKATAAELRTHVTGGKLNVLAATDGIVDVVLDELVRQGHR